MDVLKDKTILLTGGTGSFGSKFTEIALEKHNPAAIRIFSRGEKLQYDMERRFNDERLRFLIGDVRDKERLHRAMQGVDIVVHAAALKHVTACEYNPIEAVRTNINGAANIIDIATDGKIEKVMAISTDKAVHPVNLYGATKMTAEKLFIQGNSYTGSNPPMFSCVRYGNVIGSRGSVIPLFKKQKESGTLTLTSKEMTRFWITLDAGIEFVINCIGKMKGGEIFIPRIPSMKLIDIADAIAPKAKKKVIGIRPGEKLHEVLLTEDEARHSRAFKNYFVIEPEHPFWDETIDSAGSLPEGFRYESNTNENWLSKEDIINILREPNVMAVVQARTGSTRLPGKIMKKVNGITILEYVIKRLKLCKKLDKIIIATTDKKKDDIIEKFAIDNNIDYYRGSENDVLDRYMQTAKRYEIGNIVRITSDCPLIDPEIVDHIVEQHLKSKADFTSNVIRRTYPKGLDVEVIKYSALSKAHKEATKKYDREHVMPYIWGNPNKFKLLNIQAPPNLTRPDIRITLDTQEDFNIIEKVLKHFKELNFKTEEVIKYIVENNISGREGG